MAVAIEYTGDASKLAQALDSIARKQGEIESGFKKVGASGKSASSAVEKGFESGNASMLRWVGTLGSAASAVAVLTRAITDLRTVEDEAGKSLEASVPGKRLFAQLTAEKAEFAALNQHVDTLRKRGMQTEAAQDVVFKARSAGMDLEQMTPMFADLREIGFTPQAAIESVLKLQGSFGGAGRGATGAGNEREIVNKLLAGSESSPVAAQDMARVTSIVANTFASIGGQDEDLIAALAVMSNVTKTPETTAERLKMASAQIAQKRHLLPAELRDKDPLDIMAALPEAAARGELFDAEQVKGKRGGRKEKRLPVSLEKFLGSIEAVEAVRLVDKKEGEIAEVAAKIRAAESGTGTSGDLLSGRLDRVRNEPDLVAVTAKEVADQKLQLDREGRFGSQETLADAVQAARKQEFGRTSNRASAWIQGQLDSAERFLMGPESFVQNNVGQPTQENRTVQLPNYAELHEAGEALREAADTMRGGPTRAPEPRSDR